MTTNDPTNIPDLNDGAPLARLTPTDLEQLFTSGLEVPDTPSPTTPTRTPGPAQLTVADLSAKHIGKRIRVTDQGNTFTGFVEDIEYEVERLMRGNDAVGVRVIFDRASILYPLNATVTVEP